MIEARPSDAFQPGDLVNNTYRIEQLLGRGGTSDVYKARSEISGRLVALKMLKEEFSGNEDYLVLLTREEEIREVRHDAVVRYSENHRTEDGHVYLLMDYVEGPGLDKRLKQGPMTADDLLTVCRRVTEGLQEAHARHIVHRDLSPDNIILRGGDPAQAVIIDFGIAKDTNPGAETIVGNEFAGKYAYAAPEQLNGQTDARTDIYSLGALLLANFRGAKPDVGNNPMEVVQGKSRPLDTDGVPEPLKTLIDRMTTPDPDDRLPSAAAVLAFLDAPEAASVTTPSAEPGADDDATVISIPPKAAKPAGSETPPPRPTPTAPAAAKGKSRGGLIAVLAVVLIAALGAGAYVSGALDGVFGPSYPQADPFTLIVEQPDGAPLRAVGYVPSTDSESTLLAFVEGQNGDARLTLAQGDIPASWSADIMATLDALAGLDSWRLVVSGSRAQLIGRTSDPAIATQIEAAFANGLPGALDGKAEITLDQVFLNPDELTSVVRDMADCGPLHLGGAGVTGYGPEDAIMVTGKVADTTTRIALFDALRAISGDRRVVLDVEVLNPSLCLIESHLPNAPSGDIKVSYTVGDRDEPNPSGRFFVGENPVIDVLLPGTVTSGFLTVSILDVSGNVFHLLPNLNRQGNDIADLRGGAEGPVPVRVAYSIQDAALNGRLAFRVDDSTLGKSKIIILHSRAPLFDGLRPTSESAVGYAEALQAHSVTDADSILSLDSRILVTAKP